MSDVDAPLRLLVSANGTPMSDALHSAISDARIVQSVGVPDYVRLTFVLYTNDSGPGVDQFQTKIGDELKVEAGDGQDFWTIFEGNVVSLGIELDTATSQQLTVEGYDKLYKLGRATTIQSYSDQSYKDVISDLAGDASLTVGTIDESLARPVLDNIYVHGTAYAFVDEVIRNAGCEWFVENGKLEVRPRSDAQTTHTLKVGDTLRRFSARYSASEHVADVTVMGWDVMAKSEIVGTASFDAASAKSTNGIVTSNALNGNDVGGTTALSIPRPVASLDDANALAKAILERRASEVLRARGEATPHEDLKPGVLLTIEGLGSNWSGNYYCTAVEYTFGGSSLRTFFEVGPTGPDSLVDIFSGESTPSIDKMLGSLTIGIVTNNEDPDNLNRVKLKLPYLSDVNETGWARLLQLGAGASRGWMMLPEVDDEVLVGFEHGDIDRPYVLGGLVNGTDEVKYNSTALIDGGVKSRVLVSRLGHEIRLEDGGASDEQFVKIHTAGLEATLLLGVDGIELEADGIPIKVYNGDASIEISDAGDVAVVTKGDFTVKATGDVKIEGNNVEVKSKLGAKVQSGTSLDLKAGTTGALEATAPLTVKGAMVNIN
ncbi:MAG: VgrG-related protein [Ilumatobacteraceae bacterium]